MSSTNNDSEDDDPRVHSSGMSSSGGQPCRRYELSKSELRKNNKPIMEKKRRARINQCLNELKTLILDALKKDPARHTKLEKADILEMTVRHLQSLHRSGGGGGGRPAAAAAVAGPSAEPSSSPAAALTAVVVEKFQTGYQECAGEVNRFVDRLDGVDDHIKKRLMSHLDSCVAKMRYVAAAAGGAPAPHHQSHRAHDNFSLQQSFDQVAAAASLSAVVPSLRPDPAALAQPPSVRPPVGRFRASAFTAVHGLSSPDADRFGPYVYCDEPAVSSTSSWAEDVAAAAAAATAPVKSPPLDFSMKKPSGAGKRPLGDISVNVPTPAAVGSSSAHKTAATAAAAAAVSGGRRSTPPPPPPPVDRPRDGPGSDPNMWRPW